MLRRLLVVSCATLAPLAALAQSGVSDAYRCTLGSLVRRVEVVHTGAGAVPCEVRYAKDTEAPGQDQTLWSAANEAGYCEARAREFVSRLEGLGWQCSAGNAQARAAPALDARKIGPMT